MAWQQLEDYKNNVALYCVSLHTTHPKHIMVCATTLAADYLESTFKAMQALSISLFLRIRKCKPKNGKSEIESQLVVRIGPCSPTPMHFAYFRPESGVSPTHKNIYIWASKWCQTTSWSRRMYLTHVIVTSSLVLRPLAYSGGRGLGTRLSDILCYNWLCLYQEPVVESTYQWRLASYPDPFEKWAWVRGYSGGVLVQ